MNKISLDKLIIYISLITVSTHFLLIFFKFISVISLIIPHILLIVISILAEYKKNRSLFSPLSFFCYIYLITVVSSIIYNSMPHGYQLNILELEKGSSIYLLFLGIIIFSYYYSEQKSLIIQDKPRIMANLITKEYIVVICLSIFGLLLRLLLFSSSENYSLVAFIKNPLTEYSQVRTEGRNFLVFLTELFSILSIMQIIIINTQMYRKNLIVIVGTTIGFLMILLNAFLSGTKTGFFWLFVGLFAISGFYLKKLKGFKLTLVILLFIFTLFFSFAWRDGFSNIADAAESLSNYNHFFYYTSKVAVNINPDIKYLWIALKDLFTYTIPRIIWSDKPILMGLTRRFLDVDIRNVSTYYQYYQSSFATMGLGETWIASGYYGVVVSGCIMGFLLRYSKNHLTKPTSLGNIIISSYIYGAVYFILRVGFLNFYVYTLIFVIILLKTIDLLANNSKRKPFSLQKSNKNNF